MDLGASKKIRDDETLEFIIKPLKPKIPEYWYDFILLGVTGVAVTIAPGVFIAFYDVIAGILVALSGLLKPVGYAIGRKFWGNTESGEYISGGLRWLALALVGFNMDW
jgi:hypothetical protein